MAQTQLDKIESKVDSLTTLLAGDEFGNPGMVEKQRTNHARIGKLESDNKRMKIFGRVGSGILAGIFIFKEECIKLVKIIFS